MSYWSSLEEPGWISIYAGKNKRRGRRFRMVPMSPTVEQALSDWFHYSTEDAPPCISPGMKAQQNFSVMTEKLVVRALGNCWLNPWYNMRKSFCCDLLPFVRDIATYEAITKHYQIMTKGGTLKGKESNKPQPIFPTFRFLPKTSPPLLNNGGLNGGLHCIAEKCDKMKESSEVVENREVMRNKKPACMDLQTGNLAAEGFEPCQEDPIKHGISENEEWAGGRKRGRLNIETIKREILELFLLLDTDRRLEVVEVLGRLARQGVEVAAGRGARR